jgi:uncharacterized membrane protein YhiD involved in acid resistance
VWRVFWAKFLIWRKEYNIFDSSNPANLTWINVIIAIPVSLLLGLSVAFVYKQVMTNFNYAVPILHTIVYVSMIVCLIMMVVANEIARAFTLLGALSVIRFRTPIKDARDGAFIFFALAAGMGAGVGMYLESVLGTVLIGIFILLLHYSRFGFSATQEILVKFQVPIDSENSSSLFKTVFEQFLKNSNLVNTRSLKDEDKLELTFFVNPKKSTDIVEFSQALSAISSIDRVSLIVCEDDEVPNNVF